MQRNPGDKVELSHICNVYDQQALNADLAEMRQKYLENKGAIL